MPLRRPLKEADVSRKVLVWAKKNGLPSIRMVLAGSVSTGWPDYVFILPGAKTVWIEFKRPGGKPTELQRSRINTLLDLGHAAFVVDDAQEGISILSAYSAREEE